MFIEDYLRECYKIALNICIIIMYVIYKCLLSSNIMYKITIIIGIFNVSPSVNIERIISYRYAKCLFKKLMMNRVNGKTVKGH